MAACPEEIQPLAGLRVHVAGCPVDCTDLEALSDRLREAVLRRESCDVLGVNAAFVVDARRDVNYRNILESAKCVPADGFWVAAAARVLGLKGVGHVGIERLVYRLLERIAPASPAVYLLGAREEVVQEAAAALRTHYPGIRISGVRNGYFQAADEAAVFSEIEARSPDLILVGMTSPKKEYWIHQYGRRLPAGVVIGVGGLFDVLAGRVPAAPEWMKTHGLEWLFRFAHDPRRLWRRYLRGNAKFISLVFEQWIRSRIERGTIH